jgi:SAM-dependent methyltransferase
VTEIDYDRRAQTFDQVLPLWRPVSEHLATATPGLVPGASVLDVACGTGEPALTLRERHPGLRLLGVDASELMIEVARHKAARRGFTDVRFEVMNAQALDVADHSVDVVTSRFGLLSFTDPVAEAGEVARVLRPGGTIGIVTWDGPAGNVIADLMLAAADPWVPPALKAAFQRSDEHATPGRREGWLTGAGLARVHSETFSWHAEFPDDDAMWQVTTGPAMLGGVIGDVGAEAMRTIRDTFRATASEYRRPDGSWDFPYTARFFTAVA